MALNPSNGSNLEQLASKGLTLNEEWTGDDYYQWCIRSESQERREHQRRPVTRHAGEHVQPLHGHVDVRVWRPATAPDSQQAAASDSLQSTVSTCIISRDVTKFVFEFENVRTFSADSKFDFFTYPSSNSNLKSTWLAPRVLVYTHRPLEQPIEQMRIA